MVFSKKISNDVETIRYANGKKMKKVSIYHPQKLISFGLNISMWNIKYLTISKNIEEYFCIFMWGKNLFYCKEIWSRN